MSQHARGIRLYEEHEPTHVAQCYHACAEPLRLGRTDPDELHAHYKATPTRAFVEIARATRDDAFEQAVVRSQTATGPQQRVWRTTRSAVA